MVIIDDKAMREAVAVLTYAEKHPIAFEKMISGLVDDRRMLVLDGFRCLFSYSRMSCFACPKQSHLYRSLIVTTPEGPPERSDFIEIARQLFEFDVAACAIGTKGHALIGLQEIFTSTGLVN